MAVATQKMPIKPDEIPYESMTREEIRDLELGDSEDEIKRWKSMTRKAKQWELWARDPERIHPKERPKDMPDYMCGKFKKIHITSWEWQDEIYHPFQVNEFPLLQLMKGQDFVLPLEITEAIKDMNIKRLRHIAQDDAKIPFVAIQEEHIRVQYFITGDATWDDWKAQKKAQESLLDPRDFNKTGIRR